MSIEFKEGNLFDYQFDAIVNPVNCVGVMGAGLALQFKRRYPRNFDMYKEQCMSGGVRPGRVLICESGCEIPRYIVNFPTKLHWRNPSKMEYIKDGMEDLLVWVERLGITSIGIPPLGCGLGGLNWEEVKAVIADSLVLAPDLKSTIFTPSVKGPAEHIARRGG